jgi:hypothetical protein
LKKNHLHIISAALLALGVALPAAAFHDGGVGNCGGCHGESGAGVARRQLRGSDPSSTCLICHADERSPDGPHVVTRSGASMSPGGDFYWLTKNFFWAGGSSNGDGHGHNVVARDFGLRQDSRLSVAPGGSYPSSALGCTSCHDPHGKSGARGSGSYGQVSSGRNIVGNYRLLGGTGYTGGKQYGGISFKNAAPVARQSAARKYGESDSSHADYGSGMSEWCRNCHDRVHVGSSAFRHPAGVRLDSGMIENYNRYVKTGDLSGRASSSYLALVPFERGIADPAQLDPSGTRGPDGNSKVMCLTCHRAHASAFRSIGRWDFDAQAIARSHPAPGDGGATGSDVLYSYYGRDMLSRFGSSQKQFCEKCHKPK